MSSPKKGVSRRDRFSERWAEALASIDLLDSGKYHALSSEYRLLHAKTLTKLADLLMDIEALGVLRAAETLDDLTTAQLKYVNLNYYIAVLLEKTPIDMTYTAVDARISVAQLAIRKYVEFSAQLRDLGMLDVSLSRRVDFVDRNDVRAPMDMGKLIDKLMEAKVKVTSAARISRTRSVFEKCRENVELQEDNDSEVRAVEQARLAYHFELAWKAIALLVDEIMLLGKMADFFKDAPLHERAAPYVPSAYLGDFLREKSSQQGVTFAQLSERSDPRVRQKAAPDGADASTRVDAPAPSPAGGKLVGPGGKVMQPFTILPASTSAEQVRKNVFGTGQRLPTITLDQLVEKELANQLAPQIPKDKMRELQDEDDEDYVDALTMKARKWDDFVDSTPKGSGNTLNLG